MKLHTFCKLFPPVVGPDFDMMVADIKAHGLRDPITTLGGMILDGQNRQLACEAAGVAPKYEPYEGPDPLAFVVSKNLSRRQLTDDQRAAIAAEIAKAKSGNPANLAPLKMQPTIEAAATMMKVSKRNVQRAKAVKRESPAAFKAVREGKLSLNAAHEQKHPRKAKAEAETGNPITEPPAVPAHFPLHIAADGTGTFAGGLVVKHGFTPPEQQRQAMTPGRFANELAKLEFEADHACAGNQKEREKFGAIANALANRLMNPPRASGIYTR